MKVVEYTLNFDGTIPSFIVDGGNFPVSNGNASPQDWTLIGIATDDAPGVAYATEQDLSDHLAVVGADWVEYDLITDTSIPFDPAASASALWSKLTAHN